MATHKTLKSVVRNVAESFTSLMNYADGDYVMGHVVRAAWLTNATMFRANLLTGSTDDSPLLVPPVRASIEGYVKSFPDLLRREHSDLAFVTAAELIIDVEPATRRRHADSTFFESPFKCTVRIVDDRGKAYQHQISAWWYPEVGQF